MLNKLGHSHLMIIPGTPPKQKAKPQTPEAANKDKASVLQLAAKGQLIEQPTDLLREPYVFEFLKIPEPYQVSETQLETLLWREMELTLREARG